MFSVALSLPPAISGPPTPWMVAGRPPGPGLWASMTRACYPVVKLLPKVLIFIIYSQLLPLFKGEHSKIYDR